MPQNTSSMLLITPDFPPNIGGVASYLGALSRYFGARMRVQSDGLLFERFWPRWFKTVLLLVSQRGTYELVFTSHVLPFGTACFVASWLTRKPYIVIVHGMDVRLAKRSRMKRFIASAVLTHARLIVTNSNALAQELFFFGVQEALVIYPCLESIPTQHTRDRGARHILTVSRLIERKGHLRVLRALAELKQMGKLNNLVYDIVGAGDFESEIKQMTHSLGLDSTVVFHGAVDAQKLALLYSQADLFVMPVVDDPFDKEGFGLSYLEAASYGVPSIATDIPGVDEAVLQGETGVLIPDNDIGQLVGWMMKLLTDDSSRSRMGKNARERVECEFTCERQFSKLEPYL